MGADVEFVVPAAFAFLAFGAVDFDGGKTFEVVFGGGLGGLVGGFDLGDVEQFLEGQEMFDDPGGDAVVEAKLDLGFEGFADDFGLARFFEFGQDLFAQGEEVFPDFSLGFGGGEVDGGPIGFVDGRASGRDARCYTRDACAPRMAGDEFPGFVGGIGEHGGEYLAEAADHAVEGGLGGAAAWGIGGVGVEAVFDDVVIDGGKFDGGELADALIGDVEFVAVKRGDDVALELGEFAENPAVEAGEFFIRDGVLSGIEVVEVGELIAEGVADEAVGFGDFVDPFFADDDVVAVILGRDPKANHIGAVFFDVGFAGLRFFVAALALLGFRDFFAVGIHHEAVGEDGFVGGSAVAGE